MKLHPSDIAKELKDYSFFKSFHPDLLLQVSTMIDCQSFKAGEYILQEGQQNSSLYFIRRGRVEVSLAGEVLAHLENPGEVIGEMSIVTERPASTSLKALESVDCFVIRSQDFSHVHPKDADRLQALLYKVYCVVLIERLIKTNEKARLFEILNREIHEAQSVLEKSGGGRVLLIEADSKQQLPVRMALGGTGMILDVAVNAAEAKALLAQHFYEVILSQNDSVELLEEARRDNKMHYGILFADQDVRSNLAVLRQHRTVEHILSRNNEDRASTIKYLLTSLGKLINKDIFGLEKYLSWGVEVQRHLVTHSGQRDELRSTMLCYLKKAGIRNTILDRVNTVTEEMLMNAIYDAPMDAHHQPLFNHLSRKNEVHLETHQQSVLKYASDGSFLAVSVTDPFGGLTKDVVIDYLTTCYQGEAGSLNDFKGGAGRGLHQIIENADLTIFNVKKNVRTEVICLFHLDGRKGPQEPSFHYFFT